MDELTEADLGEDAELAGAAVVDAEADGLDEVRDTELAEHTEVAGTAAAEDAEVDELAGPEVVEADLGKEAGTEALASSFCSSQASLCCNDRSFASFSSLASFCFNNWMSGLLWS